MRELLWVCLGGGVGAGARYLVATGMVKAFGPGFPLGTLAVNLLGSCLLAILMGLELRGAPIKPDLRLALGTGLMGGFTTFSAFSYETLDLVHRDAWGLAALNVTASVVGCLGAAALGFALARTLTGA